MSKALDMLPVPHCFEEPTQISMDATNGLGDGECGVDPANVKADRGAPPPWQPTGGFCGRPEAWLNGAVRGVDPPLVWRADGRSTCCAGEGVPVGTGNRIVKWAADGFTLVDSRAWDAGDQEGLNVETTLSAFVSLHLFPDDPDQPPFGLEYLPSTSGEASLVMTLPALGVSTNPGLAVRYYQGQTTVHVHHDPGDGMEVILELGAGCFAVAGQVGLDSDALGAQYLGGILVTEPTPEQAGEWLQLGTAAYSAKGEFDAAGAASGSMQAHLAAANPHPQYAGGGGTPAGPQAHVPKWGTGGATLVDSGIIVGSTGIATFPNNVTIIGALTLDIAGTGTWGWTFDGISETARNRYYSGGDAPAGASYTRGAVEIDCQQAGWYLTLGDAANAGFKGLVVNAQTALTTLANGWDVRGGILFAIGGIGPGPGFSGTPHVVPRFDANGNALEDGRIVDDPLTAIQARADLQVAGYLQLTRLTAVAPSASLERDETSAEPSVILAIEAEAASGYDRAELALVASGGPLLDLRSDPVGTAPLGFAFNGEPALTSVANGWDIRGGVVFAVGTSGGGGVDPATLGTAAYQDVEYFDQAGAATGAVNAHVGAADPHTQYMTDAQAALSFDAKGAADSAVSAHVAAADPHAGYLTPARGDARYDLVGAASAAVTAHVGAADPHAGYLTPARGDARYDALGAASAAVTAHVAAADPHAGYLTPARGDARYDALGAASGAVNAHVGATDPHTQYARKTLFPGAILGKSLVLTDESTVATVAAPLPTPDTVTITTTATLDILVEFFAEAYNSALNGSCVVAIQQNGATINGSDFTTTCPLSGPIFPSLTRALILALPAGTYTFRAVYAGFTGVAHFRKRFLSVSVC